MAPRQFPATWKDNALTERSAAQAQSIDLCRLLDHPTPAEADPRAGSTDDALARLLALNLERAAAQAGG